MRYSSGTSAQMADLRHVPYTVHLGMQCHSNDILYPQLCAMRSAPYTASNGTWLTTLAVKSHIPVL